MLFTSLSLDLNRFIYMLGNALLLLVSPKQRERIREGRCILGDLIIEVDVFIVLYIDAFVKTPFKVRREDYRVYRRNA
jgi:hypothetical protein